MFDLISYACLYVVQVEAVNYIEFQKETGGSCAASMGGILDELLYISFLWLCLHSADGLKCNDL